MLAIYSQHVAVLAAVSYFALRILAVPSAARTLTTLAVIRVYILIAGAPPSAIRAGMVATLVLAAGLIGARSRPCDSQSYNALKVRFTATVGEEPEIEVALA